jgi:hypothetical protein
MSKKINIKKEGEMLEQFALGFIIGIGIVFIGMCGALLVALM